MFTVREVAERLRVSPATIYNAVVSGDLPHHRIGRGRGTIRISEEQLQRFLDGTKVEGAATATSVRLRDIKYRGRKT